jgi:hypothetical protein
MNLPILKTDGHLIPLLFYFFHITLSCFLSQSESPKVITFGEAGARITIFGKEKERNELCQRSDTKVLPKTKFSMRNTVRGDKKVYRELSF